MFDLDCFLENGALVSLDRDRILIGWGRRTRGSTPHSESPAFYFPDYFLKDENPWFHHEEHRLINIRGLISLLEKSGSGIAPFFRWENTYKPLFDWAFHDLKNQFKDGALKKGVPFVFERAKGRMTCHHLLYLLKHALDYASKQPVYLYGFWDQHQGILGATPELLFRLFSDKVRHKVETAACAGTCAPEHAQFLLDDQKQLKEHRFVIEGIEESLSVFGEVSRGPTEILQLPHLSHLVTKISLVSVEPLDIVGVVDALHPTPALGAFPKQEGFSWLRNYQTKIDRKRFGAPAGCLYANLFISYVAIRNIQWEEDNVQIGAGCGIVEESDCENEWEEIKMKIASVKNYLHL